MKKLPTTIKPRLGFTHPDDEEVLATLVMRTDKVIMYLRTDGYYEVGMVRKAGETIWGNGDISPPREIYFNDENFGTRAKTTPDYGRAVAYYNEYCLNGHIGSTFYERLDKS